MTAHIRFTAWDADNPATQSRFVIEQIIRQRIGFGGLLLSDDIDMEALEGTVPERSLRAIAAGCDLVLYCWARIDAMEGIADCLPAITQAASDRLDRAMSGAGKLAAMPPREELLATRNSFLDLLGERA